MKDITRPADFYHPSSYLWEYQPHFTLVRRIRGPFYMVQRRKNKQVSNPVLERKCVRIDNHGVKSGMRASDCTHQTWKCKKKNNNENRLASRAPLLLWRLVIFIIINDKPDSSVNSIHETFSRGKNIDDPWSFCK